MKIQSSKYLITTTLMESQVKFPCLEKKILSHLQFVQVQFRYLNFLMSSEQTLYFTAFEGNYGLSFA